MTPLAFNSEMVKPHYVTTRAVKDFMLLRESLQTAKGSAESAESAFKGIEGKSNDLRRLASSIDTYEARNDNESKNCSDSGKAAVKTLNGMARQQDALEELHRSEEGARKTSTQELTEASGLVRGLNVAPNVKASLLNAINNAQQQNNQGSYDYTNVDTTIFAAGLELPNALENATSISQDSDGQDKSLQGTFLDQRSDKLENTYGQASSYADRAETYQDRVGGEVEKALIELSRLEAQRSFEMVMGGAPLVGGGPLQAFAHLVAQDSQLTLNFAGSPPAVSSLNLEGFGLETTFQVLAPDSIRADAT